MLEGSFRPASSAAGHHPQYPIPKSGYTEQASPVVSMRKDPPGPSFTPVHDRPVSSHSPDYESEDHQQSGSPPGASHFFQSHHSMATNPQSNQQSSAHQSASEVPQPPSITKLDGRPSQESIPKNSSIGPVRAKKKPAGSACNSCHRLKTRCSGGHPCDRCAAHKVACQFDRDLIYRSPLASSSQQASARHPHGAIKGEPLPGGKPRSRSGPKAGRKFPPASGPSGLTQSASTTPILSMSLPQVTHLSAPSLPTLSAPIPPQGSSFSAMSSKQGNKLTPISTPQPHESYVNYEHNLPHPNGLHVRLAALENSVSGLLQVLRAQQSSNANFPPPASEPRPPLSPPTPPTLVVSGSSTFGPEKDQPNDPNRLGCPNPTPGLGDPLSEGILSATQLQYLYDVFVEFCLPSLPILHSVQIASIRARSSFLFTVMVAIGARFCSSQSVARIPPQNCLMSSSTGARVDLSQITIDETTYARLVALAHQHLSITLLRSMNSLEDVRAILFLACWALVSNEDPSGAPNRWVLIGHAGRIGRTIGLHRLESELRTTSNLWNNPELHEHRRNQLDAVKANHALQAVETILSSNLRLEPSRDFFPPLQAATEHEPNFTIVKLSKGSPFQYDVVSAAQIESLAELAEIWAAANCFLSVADDRSRTLTSEQLIELGEHHNKVMDAWAKKWTWHGSSWAPLLGANLRTVRLLSESLRITLNLAFTNVLYAIAAGTRITPKFHDTLAMAIERVNGSSTAVIQAHRDSVREGFSLAFAPDLVTDGLVSAAITVLQLASPIGLPTMLVSKMNAQDSKKRILNTYGPSSNLEALARDERLPTPHSGEDRADVDMTGANASSASGPHPHIPKGPAYESRTSSPGSTPRRLSKASSPHTTTFLPDAFAGGTQLFGKKCFMEPPVAAHYIRMATDVLQSSDRSQTRLGTTMASKIMKLATQAGLMGPPSTTNLVGSTSTTSYSPNGGMLTLDERPSISSTSSLSSTRPAPISSAEHPEGNHQHKLHQDGVNGSDNRATDISNPESPTRQAEDDDDYSSENIQIASQQRVAHIAQPGSEIPDAQQDVHEDELPEGNELGDDSCEGNGDVDEEDQMTGDSHSFIHHEHEPIERDAHDMMEEDQ
ncbi:hypothetical protein PtB15_15B493 [Puccinia triticina]|nr:hypothetical protein PtB15_15B493 [Puccinia triticina]